MTNKIFIATGGTGGHVFPALALAGGLVEDGFDVVILGDGKCAKLYSKDDDYRLKYIYSSQINGGFLKLLQFAIKSGLGVLQSLFWMILYRPQKIVAFGGFATFPVLIAAVILRRTIILHEQNAHLGKVNRIFARFAKKIALSYENTDGLELIKNIEEKTVFTGNPIREEILALSKKTYKLPDFSKNIKKPDNLGYNVLLASEFKDQDDEDQEMFNILVIGGSGGAKIFSEILPKAFFNLRDEIKNNIHIYQQCRKEDLSITFEQYKNFNLSITIDHFFKNMAKEIDQAHLIIARAGSSSLAEFTAAKKPMILVPFAKAADNHQLKNSKEIEKAGAAIVIEERDFNINKVADILGELFDNRGVLLKMSKKAFGCAHLDAMDRLLGVVLGLDNIS